MNRLCPNCQASYNINEQHLGRTFTCQRCQSQLVVQPDGIQVAGAAQQPSPGAAQQPATGAAQYGEGQYAPQQPAAYGGAVEGGFAGASQDPYGTEGDFGAPGTVRRRSSASSSPFMDFLLFRRMIAPILIQILFWFGVVMTVLMGLGTMIAGIVATSQRGGAAVGMTILLFGFVTLVSGPVVVRLYCEVLIIFFRINETLTDIKGELEKNRT